MAYKQQLETYIEEIIKEGGSDLHFSIDRHPTLRVSGLLIPMVKFPVLKPEDLQGLTDALLTSDQKELFKKDKSVDLSFAYKGGTRFRCNCFYQSGSIGIAMRHIPDRIRTLQELNLPEVLESFTKQKQGFFLVVGPTGHGKTTTLAAMVELINSQRAEHIVTIEDPIEYIYEDKKSLIDQREIRLDANDFPSALNNIFRQDADVVLIGEMRERETMSTAVTAAETGHLVFSTLHTNNAVQTIDRIIDTFPADQQIQIRTQLAETLTGIFSQRLIPRISGGVVPTYELLINSTAVANLIRERRTHEINSVIETSSDQGMIHMNRTLASLVRAGEITIESAKKYSLNPKMLERLI